MKLKIDEITKKGILLSWDKVEGATSYRLCWKDRNRKTMQKKALLPTTELRAMFNKMPRIPYYLSVQALNELQVIDESPEIKTPVTVRLNEQLEKIDRGLVAVSTGNGIFVSWRLYKSEVKGYSNTGLTGTDFALCKNGKVLAFVTDSTNYLDNLCYLLQRPEASRSCTKQSLFQ